MTALIVAEHNHLALKASTFNTIGAAQKFEGPVDVLIAGYNLDAAAQQAAQIEGVRQILVFNDPALENFSAESLTEATLSIARNYTHVLTPATTFGKNFLPRVAALLDVTQLSDIIEIINSDTFLRPIYAGNAIATLKTHEAIKVISIRPTAFTAARSGTAIAPIVPLSVSFKGRASIFKNRVEVKSLRPDLTSARIIVSGGRGVQSRENFRLIEDLADILGAGIGASRAAVDAGYVPNDYQIGQTGKIVAPEIYIAVGISGAIQHLAGMKESKVIIAINKDPDAPIFQIADYGLVGDLFEVVPQLIHQLQKLKLNTSLSSSITTF